MRGLKPVSPYFETGKTDAPLSLAKELEALVLYASPKPDALIGISGFHDSTGNVAANVELAKNRANSVREALCSAGIGDNRIFMDKPMVMDGGSDREGRRVDVFVKQ